MVVKISKWLGIPASLKTANQQLNNLLGDRGVEASIIRTEALSGKYLCIKKMRERGGYVGYVTTYPIYVSTNKLNGAIKCVKKK